jgi:hypothetical protein
MMIKIRNPKFEIRKKAEDRNPNGVRTVESLAAASFSCRFKSGPPPISRHVDFSEGDVGFRISEFFRVSDLGLRTSPHFP